MNELHREIESVFGEVPSWLKAMPSGAAHAFWSAFRDVYLVETGPLSRRQKALIAFATAAAMRDERATTFHREVAKLLGATDAELAEASAAAGLVAFAATTMIGQQLDTARIREETLRETVFARINGGVRADAPVPAHPAATHEERR